MGSGRGQTLRPHPGVRSFLTYPASLPPSQIPVHVYGVSGRHAEHNTVSDLKELKIPMEGNRKAGKKNQSTIVQTSVKKKDTERYRRKDSNSQKRRDGGSRL